MSLWTRLTGREDRNPARDLANIGHTQRRNKVKAVARALRRDLGLPPHPGLNDDK